MVAVVQLLFNWRKKSSVEERNLNAQREEIILPKLMDFTNVNLFRFRP